jgi:integrating conjugative element membrane protein (TIGR03747 family)
MARTTANSAPNRRAQRPVPKTAEESAQERSGLLLTLIEFPFLVIKTLALSLLVSIVIALIGVTWFWPEEGSLHELRTLNTELNELAVELRVAGSSFNLKIEEWVSAAMGWSWFADSIGRGTTWVATFFSPKAKMYGEVTYYATLIFITRLGVIVSSLPILLIWFVLGIVCGLTERDLRRFNGAVESSTVFNLAVSHLRVPFVFCIALYLSFPTRAYAILATMPVCLGTFLLTFLSIAHYKKRL